MKRRIEIQERNPIYFSVWETFFDEGEMVWRSQGSSKHFAVRRQVGNLPIWPIIEEITDGFDRLELTNVVDYSSVSQENAVKKAYALAKEYAASRVTSPEIEIFDNTRFAKSGLEASAKS